MSVWDESDLADNTSHDSNGDPHLTNSNGDLLFETVKEKKQGCPCLEAPLSGKARSELREAGARLARESCREAGVSIAIPRRLAEPVALHLMEVLPQLVEEKRRARSERG